MVYSIFYLIKHSFQNCRFQVVILSWNVLLYYDNSEKCNMIHKYLIEIMYYYIIFHDKKKWVFYANQNYFDRKISAECHRTRRIHDRSADSDQESAGADVSLFPDHCGESDRFSVRRWLAGKWPRLSNHRAERASQTDKH